MSETDPLADLLAAADLDALDAARRRLPRLGELDDERLSAVLQAWDDVQAVANLLMHPELVPEPLRLRALLRALRDDAQPYLGLAASVGLQALADDPLQDDPADDPQVQAQVVAALERLAAGSGAVADRAAVALHAWSTPDARGPLPALAAVPDYQEWRRSP